MKLLDLRALCAFALTILISTQAIARPDRNAFVNIKVQTTAQLVRHVAKDPKVMDRYMRHYGMTRQQVLHFLGSLHPGSLQASGVFTVFSVPEGGFIKVHTEKLKKGHRMFFRKDGQPELILKCGNPVSLGPMDLLAENKDPVTTSEVIAEESPLELVSDVAMGLEPLAAFQPLEPVYTLGPITEISSIPLGIGAISPLPLVLGGLVFINDGGGGGGNGEDPVPEPVTTALMGAGALYYGMRRRKAKQKAAIQQSPTLD